MPASAVDDDEPSVRIFSKSSGDAGKVSGARSSKTSAEPAYLHRATMGGPDTFTTHGTSGLTIEQHGEVVRDTGLPIRAIDDSAITDPAGPEGHTCLDPRHRGDKPRKPDKRALRAAICQQAMKNRRLWRVTCRVASCRSGSVRHRSRHSCGRLDAGVAR